MRSLQEYRSSFNSARMLDHDRNRRTGPSTSISAPRNPGVVGWWRCKDPDCAAKTWTEEIAGVTPRTMLTDGPGPRSSGGSARTPARWPRWHAASGWDGTPPGMPSRPCPPPASVTLSGDVVAMGVDETALLAAIKDHPRIFATGGRRPPEASSWASSKDAPPPSSRAGWVGAPRPARRRRGRHHRSPGGLPVRARSAPRSRERRGRSVLHREARQPGHRRRARRTQQAITDHRGRRGDPLYDIRKILLSSDERLTNPGPRLPGRRPGGR